MKQILFLIWFICIFLILMGGYMSSDFSDYIINIYMFMYLLFPLFTLYIFKKHKNNTKENFIIIILSLIVLLLGLYLGGISSGGNGEGGDPYAFIGGFIFISIYFLLFSIGYYIYIKIKNIINKKKVIKKRN